MKINYVYTSTEVIETQIKQPNMYFYSKTPVWIAAWGGQLIGFDEA